MSAAPTSPLVTRVYSAREDKWGIEFEDGTLLHCAKHPFRDEARVEAMIAHHADGGGDVDHTMRMQAMIGAVRGHEATL